MTEISQGWQFNSQLLQFHKVSLGKTLALCVFVFFFHSDTFSSKTKTYISGRLGCLNILAIFAPKKKLGEKKGRVEEKRKKEGKEESGQSNSTWEK